MKVVGEGGLQAWKRMHFYNIPEGCEPTVGDQTLHLQMCTFFCLPSSSFLPPLPPPPPLLLLSIYCRPGTGLCPFSLSSFHFVIFPPYFPFFPSIHLTPIQQ